MLLRWSGAPSASCRDPGALTISPMAKKDARGAAVVRAANTDVCAVTAGSSRGGEVAMGVCAMQTVNVFHLISRDFIKI